MRTDLRANQYLPTLTVGVGLGKDGTGMSNPGERLEQELIGQWDTNKPLPDRVYFGKVLKRNWAWLVIGGLCSLAAAYSLPKVFDNTYRSSVYAIFDHVDVSGSGMGTSPQVRYNTVARLFRARFESQDFLTEIAAKVGGKDVVLREGPVSLWLNNLLKSRFSPKAEPDDEKIAISRVLSKQLDPFPEPESGVLVLNSYTHDPKLSQDLANAAMELFIRKELEEQIKSLDIKLSFLQKNIVKQPEPIRRGQPTPSVSATNRAEKLKSEDKVQELEDRLRNLNSQLDGVRLERDQASAAVKRDLVRMLTTLQPNHPQVVEKRKEVEAINSQYAGSEAKISGELDRVRRQLWAVRSSQPFPVDVMDVDIRQADIYQGSFYVAVADRIKDIELEKKNLQRQVVDPSLRTRIRIIFPATYEPNAYKNQRRNIRFGTLMAGGLFTLLLVGLREMRHPFARDAWRIERSTGKALVAQISQQNATEFADISPRLADQLRAHLSKVSRIDDAARMLLSYRRIELSVMQSCRGQIVLLINAGAFDETAQVIKNFLNIYATDHQDDFLLIDANLQDPVYRKPSKDGPDLVDFLEGRARFDELIVKRESSEDFAFDILPPMLKLSGEKTRSFRTETIEGALRRVPKGYRQIFIRAMPASHFIENTALLRVATDAFIFIDANRTSYFDLQRTLTHMESDKIRGLVALGT